MVESFKRPAVKLLLALHIFLIPGAVFGGGSLVIDPSGNLLRLPLSLLENSPFSSYFLPGLILLLIFSGLPAVTVWGMVRKPAWKTGQLLNFFKINHWFWSFSLYTGFALIIWIIIQMYFLQEVLLIHLVFAGLGLLIQAVTLLPQVQAYAAEEKQLEN